MNKKICVYAICKDEIKNVDKWLKSMSEADYIVVLDTGSTDGTYEYLKKDDRCTLVKQQTIKPWRFDVARNESMKLIPNDAEILVCTDIDEWFEPGWAKILRENWLDNDTRCHYTYAWSHNSVGEPTDVFKYDKIHTKDYHWIFPVHEVLYPNDDLKQEYIFDAGESIYLHHFQDLTKQRGSYFDLLQVSVKENPKDSHVKMLLAREYLVRNDYENALKEYLECLEMPDILESNKKLVHLETINKIAMLFAVKGDYDNAIKYYNKFLQLDKTHREPYFGLAEIYNEMKIYNVAKVMVELGLKESKQHYDWVEAKDNWIAKDKDIISLSEYYLGEYDNAIKHVQEALEHDPHNERLLKNAYSFMKAKLKQIENKLGE